jgi:zinc transport system permease protein
MVQILSFINTATGTMINLISDPQTILSLLIGVFVGGAAGYVGTVMLSERMSLMGDAIGHLTLPGVSLALFYGLDVSLGASIFLFFEIFVIWFLKERTKIPIEAITAVVFSSSLAMAFLFLPRAKTAQALLGDLSSITYTVTIIAIIVSVFVILAVRKLYPKLILIGISNDLAQIEGINAKWISFFYLVCMSVIIALGVRIIGGLMTAALVAIPACTSKNFSRNLSQYAYLGLLCGSVSCAVGIALSIASGFTVGPMIIISNTALFIFSVFFCRK